MNKTIKQTPGELLAQSLARVVIMGAYIPAHDETSDLAAEIAASLEKFRAYIAKARNADYIKEAA